jgi:hypothetical protein
MKYTLPKLKSALLQLQIRALFLSEAHWIDIRNGKSNETGANACACCIAFRCLTSTVCKNCPIYEFTGYNLCRCTPYVDALCAVENKINRTEACQLEIDFLRKVRQSVLSTLLSNLAPSKTKVSAYIPPIWRKRVQSIPSFSDRITLSVYLIRAYRRLHLLSSSAACADQHLGALAFWPAHAKPVLFRLHLHFMQTDRAYWRLTGGYENNGFTFCANQIANTQPSTLGASL